MKTMFFGILIFPRIFFTQTAYSTSFNAGHGWSLNAYTNLNVTVEGDSPNKWYVSDKESNKGVGNRGGANCGNVTLHVGSTTIGDAGAAFDAGGCTNLGFGPCASCVGNGLYCVTTDRSATSPLISTLTYSALNLSFVYIHWGTALLDNGEIIYSVDGGTTWIKLADVPKSGCCSGGASCLTGCTNNATCTGSHQGKWQSYTAAMPAAALGISTLKLGFRWFNDDVSTSGRDPSIAVDDVTLFDPVLPIRLAGFNCSSNADNISLNWETYSEINFEKFIIERSTDALGFGNIGEVFSDQSQPNSLHSYSYIDRDVQRDETYYYRLKCVDKDGSFRYSEIHTGNAWGRKTSVTGFISDNILSVKCALGSGFREIKIFDLTGRLLLTTPFNGDREFNEVEVNSLIAGVYLLQLSGDYESETVKVIAW